MGTRLVGLVLLPLVGFTVFGGAWTWEHRDRVQASRAVHDTVQRVELLVAADQLTNERVFLLGALVVGHDAGADVALTSELVGIDVAARGAAIDEELAGILAELGPDDPLHPRAEEVVALLARTAGESGVPASVDAVSAASDASGNLSAEALDDAETLFLRSGGSSTQRRLHQVARTALDAMNDVGFQIEAAGLLYGTDDVEERVRLMRRLRRATAEHDRDRATLESITAGGLRHRWERIDLEPANRVNAAWLQELSEIDPAELPPLDVVALAEAVGDGLRRMQALGGLSRAALAEAHAVAEAAADRAADDLRRNLLLTLLVVGATGLLLVVIARSIGGPIRGLAAAAERVSAGDLHGTEVPDDGPPEMRRVMAILREVLANLRTVEAQVGALAGGDLHDEVLEAPVPGRLGSLLHASVARLSGSIVEREQLQERLRHEATHDPLTQLPNRGAAREALVAALERGRRAGAPVAALFVDLDGFKQVNDAHGHDVGDHVLQVTATRLGRVIRAGDLVARIGGDEFVVIAEQAGDAFAMRQLGDRLIAALREPISVGAVTTRVSASVGVALALDGEVDADAVLRDADLAAYRAKLLGRGRVELFDEALRAEVARRLELEHALRGALAADALELHFQPVVTPGGATASVEALVRWPQEDGTFIPPGDFVPVAEGSDLIIDLDRWVLDRACRHLRAWEDDPVLGQLTMSVNLSGRHLLNLTVVEDVRSVLERTGADPSRLVLEITETVLVTDLALVTDHLDRLRQLGLRIAIDDFGTGYTSLTHLRSLPVDVVKIDRSMVVGERPSDHHVLKLLVDVAHALGLRLVAEGVETDDQLHRLRALGCDHIQGFLFSHPVPVPDLVAAVSRATASSA